MPRLLVNLDLNKFELQNARIQNLSGDPGTPVEGQIYYNTTTKTLEFYNGTAFVALGRLDQVEAPTASVSLNSQRITNLSDPSAAQDAATKTYVDAIRQGLDVKDSVRAATTANITLSGTQTVDGVALVAGDRVLVKDQTTGSQNGIWVVAAGAWSRATDADVSAEVTPGMYVFVEEGTTNADSGWVLTTNAPITLGTTALTFAQFTGAGAISAGAGLIKTGNTLDVGAGTGITVNADNVQIANGGVGTTQLADGAVTSAKIADGTITNTDISASAAIAVSKIDGAVRKYAASVGDGAATSYVVTHNLGTQDVMVMLRDNTTPFAFMLPDFEATSTNTVTVRFATAPTTNQYRVVVMG